MSETSGEWADRLNGLPKYVVSSTQVTPVWQNSKILKRDVVDEVRKLKQPVSRDILVYASYQLGQLLIERDLVDELRLVLFAVVLDTRRRLFGSTSDKSFRWVDTRTLGQGLVFVTYQWVASA